MEILNGQFARLFRPMPRNVSVGALILVVVATVAALVVISLSKLRYLAELEPPARYNHPYDGPVDERVAGRSAGLLQVSGCFWSLCSLRMGERRRLPYCLAKRWASVGFYLSSARNCSLQRLAGKSPPRQIKSRAVS
jgi:hypothetical protein